MEKEKYVSDLKEIRSMMDRSSRFISLSGIAGVAAGCFALAGAYLAFRLIFNEPSYESYQVIELTANELITLISIATGVLVLSLASGLFFTMQRSRKTRQALWDAQGRRMVANLAIPLITGGILCIILLLNGLIGLTFPMMLIFYGLGLINASKYTLSEVRSLGIAQVTLGLLAAYFINYGLLFWAAGFGGLHIIYGLAMYMKYDREGDS